MELKEREKIVKTLKCHASGKLVECEQCPLDKAHLFNATCVQAMCDNALALIKELTEENKGLNKLREKELLESARVFDSYCRMIVALRKEVEEAKSDAVRKMHEKLNAEVIKRYEELPDYKYYIDVIDMVVKELLEEE